MSFVVTRAQLYDLVWSEPMRLLARRIGVSDVAVAKHCRKAGIPVPPRGYWAKLAAGKQVKRIALAPRDLITVNQVQIASGTLPQELRDRVAATQEEELTTEVMAERLRKRLGNVTVPRDFIQAHPLILALLAKDEERRRKMANSSFGYLLDPPKFDDTFERRRLRILNALFLALERMGAGPWLRDADARELSVMMGDFRASFTLDRLGIAGRGRSTPKAESNVAMCIAVSVGSKVPAGVVTQWQDGEGGRIEARLADIIVGLAVAEAHAHRAWLAQQAQWELERQERVARESEERRLAAERKGREHLAAIAREKREQLICEARAWSTAALIRAYVAARLEEAPTQPPDIVLQTWAGWALAEVAKIDPIQTQEGARDWTEPRPVDGTF